VVAGALVVVVVLVVVDVVVVDVDGVRTAGGSVVAVGSTETV
jgi:hypothetical protein